MDHETVEVEPDNYFNPGTPVADFRVDSNGVVEILTERTLVEITTYAPSTP